MGERAQTADIIVSRLLMAIERETEKGSTNIVRIAALTKAIEILYPLTKD